MHASTHTTEPASSTRHPLYFLLPNPLPSPKALWSHKDRMGVERARHASCRRPLAGPPALRRSPDVLQGVALVDDDPACGAGVVLLQVLHQAAAADCRGVHISGSQGCSSHWPPTPGPQGQARCLGPPPTDDTDWRRKSPSRPSQQ